MCVCVCVCESCIRSVNYRVSISSCFPENRNELIRWQLCTHLTPSVQTHTHTTAFTFTDISNTYPHIPPTHKRRKEKDRESSTVHLTLSLWLEILTISQLKHKHRSWIIITMCKWPETQFIFIICFWKRSPRRHVYDKHKFDKIESKNKLLYCEILL